MNMGNGASTLLSVVFEPVAVCFAPPFKIIDLLLPLFNSDLCVTLSAASRLARSVDFVQFSSK